MQEVCPSVGIHRFNRWSKPLTKGLSICRRKGGRARLGRKGLSYCRDPSCSSQVRSAHKMSGRLSARGSGRRSVLLRRSVVLGREKVCPIVGSPERTDAPPLKEGLAFCGGPSFQSLVKASHKRSGHTKGLSVCLHDRLSPRDRRSVLLSRFVGQSLSQKVWPHKRSVRLSA
ncbi:MAG: hypothetical protein RLZZ179_1243 [Verrucomicrobiota bacterium]|jgi:hypothetical protein